MEGQRQATGFLTKIGANEVIRQLSEMEKVVTWLQIKNKWDHLRKRWKIYNKCLVKETGLGYDPVTRKFDALDEWWDRKIAVSCDQILVSKTLYCLKLHSCVLTTCCPHAGMSRGKNV